MGGLVMGPRARDILAAVIGSDVSDRAFGFGTAKTIEIAAYVLSGCYELEVASQRLPCEVQLEPLYDARMARVKG